MTGRFIRNFQRLARDRAGTMLVETAIVAPALMTLCIGAYEISVIVAHQSQLQSAAEQATELAIAVSPETNSELTQIREVLKRTTGVIGANIKLDYKYRCGTEGTLSQSAGSCDEDRLATYIEIQLRDEYIPLWAEWGIGEAFDYQVNRTVQVS